MSRDGPIDWKTFLNNDAGTMSSEQEDAFIEFTSFTSSGSETEEKVSKMTAKMGWR